ncbi:YdeI/OmpD-associated family protein, partial [Candidatus Microgenomates bacterium]|nr:YdeI/OmpD-associated family protein [Candidatus Microgenomates bacterium]
MWHTRKNVLVPADLAKRLRGNSDIKAVFEAMRPSCQHRYVTWVMEA